jgi:hypothetical protein
MPLAKQTDEPQDTTGLSACMRWAKLVTANNLNRLQEKVVDIILIKIFCKIQPFYVRLIDLLYTREKIYYNGER